MSMHVCIMCMCVHICMHVYLSVLGVLVCVNACECNMYMCVVCGVCNSPYCRFVTNRVTVSIFVQVRCIIKKGNLNFKNQAYQIPQWNKFSQSYLSFLTHFTLFFTLFWPKYSDVAACSLGLPTGKSVSALPQFPHHSVCQISINQPLSGGNPAGPLSDSEVAQGLSEILTWKRGLSGPKQLERRSWYENSANGFITRKTIWGFLSLRWRAPVRSG